MGLEYAGITSHKSLRQIYSRDVVLENRVSVSSSRVSTTSLICTVCWSDIHNDVNLRILERNIFMLFYCYAYSL